MEIQPATLDQIARARNGREVLIPADLGGIAKDLQDLDPDLELRYNELSEHFTVLKKLPDGKHHLVMTALECDERIIKVMQRIMAQDYSLADELDSLEDQRKREHEHRLSEKVGDMADRLAHALGKDFGWKNRAYIPNKGT